MASNPSVIRQLPADAIAQIRSSTIITSLNGVVIELLKNSLDAQSSKVEVSVDYPRGTCTVEDNGSGIRPAEFKDDGGLGKIYHTSKQNSPNAVYGGSGIFVFSLGALSLLQITSRHHLYHSVNSLSIHRSKVIARQTPAAIHQNTLPWSHGTHIVVCDLFGNMPVRIKHRADEAHRPSGTAKDWEELRKIATGLMLAWPRLVNITIRDITSDRKIQFRGIRETELQESLNDDSVIIAHVCSILSQAMLISSPNQSKWIPVNASTTKICIQGAISLEPAPTKAVQFISLDIEPLIAPAGHNLLYDEINGLFKNSSFGTDDDMVGSNEFEIKRKSGDTRYRSDGFTQKELKGGGKGVDRWPMFFIRIAFMEPIPYFSRTKDVVLNEPGLLNPVVELLQVMLLEFLRRHYFRPRPRGKLNSSQNLLSRSMKSASISTRVERGNESNASRSVNKSRGNDSRDMMEPQSANQTHKHRTDSPFNEWSRIKSGTKRLLISAFEQACNLKDHEALQGSEPNGSDDAVDPTGEARGPYLYSIPALTKSGQLNRQPFNNLTLPKSVDRGGEDAAKRMATSLPPNDTSATDSVIAWMDPITKNKSLVNGRTGFVMPSATSSRTQSLLHKSTGQPAHQPSLTLLSTGETSPLWIEDVLRKWNNPIFQTGETPIPKAGIEDANIEIHQVLHGNLHHCSQLEIDRALQASSARFTGRISKSDLRQARVISQVDKKFILVKIASRGSFAERIDRGPLTETLILVDQHAADERCRIEDLLEQLCKPPLQYGTSGSVESQLSGIFTSALEKPLQFIMAQREADLLREFSQHFANWGILYELPPAVAGRDNQTEQQKIVVRSLPPVIVEKCLLAPKLLIDLLRSEAWRCYERGGKFDQRGQFRDDEQDGADGIHKNGTHAWLKKIHGCPQGILDMLTSRSCRSAIMFNDELSETQCRSLLSRLADCAFPFQCAHGRPSMIPLVDLGNFQEQKVIDKCEGVQNPADFKWAFSSWKRSKAAPTDPLPELHPGSHSGMHRVAPKFHLRQRGGEY